MIKKLLVGLSIAASGFGVFASSNNANAGTCQAQTMGWPFSLNCNWRASGWGETEAGTGRKIVFAFMKGEGSGVSYALTNGLNSSGNLISTCKAIDDELDLFPEDDSSGCSSAVGGYLVGPLPYPGQ